MTTYRAVFRTSASPAELASMGVLKTLDWSGENQYYARGHRVIFRREGQGFAVYTHGGDCYYFPADAARAFLRSTRDMSGHLIRAELPIQVTEAIAFLAGV